MVEQPRSTQRYEAQPKDEEDRIDRSLEMFGESFRTQSRVPRIKVPSQMENLPVGVKERERKKVIVPDSIQRDARRVDRLLLPIRQLNVRECCDEVKVRVGTRLARLDSRPVAGIYEDPERMVFNIEPSEILEIDSFHGLLNQTNGCRVEHLLASTKSLGCGRIEFCVPLQEFPSSVRNDQSNVLRDSKVIPKYFTCNFHPSKGGKLQVRLQFSESRSGGDLRFGELNPGQVGLRNGRCDGFRDKKCPDCFDQIVTEPSVKFEVILANADRSCRIVDDSVLSKLAGDFGFNCIEGHD